MPKGIYKRTEKDIKRINWELKELRKTRKEDLQDIRILMREKRKLKGQSN